MCRVWSGRGWWAPHLDNLFPQYCRIESWTIPLGQKATEGYASGTRGRERGWARLWASRCSDRNLRWRETLENHSCWSKQGEPVPPWWSSKSLYPRRFVDKVSCDSSKTYTHTLAVLVSTPAGNQAPCSFSLTPPPAGSGRQLEW